MVCQAEIASARDANIQRLLLRFATIEKGSRVCIEGLVKAHEMNGRTGVCTAFSQESGRWTVDVFADGAKPACPGGTFREGNLRLIGILGAVESGLEVRNGLQLLMEEQERARREKAQRLRRQLEAEEAGDEKMATLQKGSQSSQPLETLRRMAPENNPVK